jgi:hypothetical protein
VYDEPLAAPNRQGVHDAAWSAYQRQPRVVTRARALVGGLTALPWFAIWLLHFAVPHGGRLRWLAGGLSLFVFALLMPGLEQIAIALARGKSVEATDVFHGTSKASTWAATALLHVLAVSAGLILVVPGVMLQQRLKFAEAFAVDHDLGPLEALEASWRATRRQGWALFKMDLGRRAGAQRRDDHRETGARQRERATAAACAVRCNAGRTSETHEGKPFRRAPSPRTGAGRG